MAEDPCTVGCYQPADNQPSEMNESWQLIIIWLTMASVTGFFTMGVDKARARNGEWRIAERTLYALALVGGAFGITIGSGIFHHKTRKDSFASVTLVITVIWIGILVELRDLLGSPFS